MKKISLSDFKPILAGNNDFLYFRVDSRTCSTRYLIRSCEKTLLIDSGDGEDELDFIPDVCILTHCHYDHSRGATGWKNVFYGENEDPSLPYVEIPPRAKTIGAGCFVFERYSLEIINSPGHTHGGICIFEPKNKILFSGDTLFAGGVWGRTDLGGADSTIQKSLSSIRRFDWKILCPGHGRLEIR